MLLSMTLAVGLAAAEPAAVPNRRTPQAREAAAAAALADEESAEKIAADALGDLRDARLYNRPGATRADYNADWQTCRLIARGSRSPTGDYTYMYYNPAVVSPLAAGIGGAIGGAIAQAIIEARLRRANRRQCLLIRGWRRIEVTPAEERLIAAMSDAQLNSFFDGFVGARNLGTRELRTWNNDFAAPRLAQTEAAETEESEPEDEPAQSSEEQGE